MDEMGRRVVVYTDDSFRWFVMSIFVRVEVMILYYNYIVSG